MKSMKICLFILLSLTIAGIANAATSITVNSPSSGWYNTYSVVLNISMTDNTNLTFNTSYYTTITTISDNVAQANITLNSTYLDDANNTIFIYATNTTNTADRDQTQIPHVAVDVSAPLWTQTPTNNAIAIG